MDQPKA